MRDAIIETLLNVAMVGVETVLFGVLTTIGLLSEQTGLSSVLGGEMIGFWYIYVGAVALYAGLYLVGYDRLLPRIVQRLSGT